MFDHLRHIVDGMCVKAAIVGAVHAAHARFVDFEDQDGESISGLRCLLRNLHLDDATQVQQHRQVMWRRRPVKLGNLRRVGFGDLQSVAGSYLQVLMNRAHVGVDLFLRCALGIPQEACQILAAGVGGHLLIVEGGYLGVMSPKFQPDAQSAVVCVAPSLPGD